MERDKLRASFLEREPLLNEYASKLKSLVTEIVDPELKFGFLVTARVKSVNSFVDKALRKEYTNPLVEIQDQIGVRVVAYFTDQVREICSNLDAAFEVDAANSEDKGTLLKVNETGYLSNHLVVQLGPDRASLPEWKRFVGINAEIQVRTHLQHAWAQIEHSLRYKSPSNAPKNVLRRLNNLSALLELADGEFLRVRDEIRLTAAMYREQVGSGELDVEINLESLREYLNHSPDWGLPEVVETPEWLLQAILARVSEVQSVKTLQQIDSVALELRDFVDPQKRTERPFSWRTPGDIILDTLHLIQENPDLLERHLRPKTRSTLIQDFVDRYEAEYLDQLISPYDD